MVSNTTLIADNAKMFSQLVETLPRIIKDIIFLNLQNVEASTNMPATPMQDEYDPLAVSDFDFLVNNPTFPSFELPQTESMKFH